MLLNKSQAKNRASSIDIKFFKFDYHVIWVENLQKGVYLFTGHPVDEHYYEHLHRCLDEIDEHYFEYSYEYLGSVQVLCQHVFHNF